MNRHENHRIVERGDEGEYYCLDCLESICIPSEQALADKELIISGKLRHIISPIVDGGPSSYSKALPSAKCVICDENLPVYRSASRITCSAICSYERKKLLERARGVTYRLRSREKRLRQYHDR